jgi:hypothetical protein
MVASLFLCAAALAPQIVTHAKAQPSSTQAKPVMMALAGAPGMAERRGAMCGEIGARAAGRLAYLEARLDLSAAQAPLFERWKQVRLARAGRIQDKCETRRTTAAADRSPVARLARQEARLKQRLADIGAERPALDALYGHLTDEQKARFGRGGPRPMRAAMLRRGGPMGYPPMHYSRGRMAPAPPDGQGGLDAPPPPQ